MSCQHRLGDRPSALVCDRLEDHDPDAAGGHTYTSSDGSEVDDRHPGGGHG